MIFFFSVYIFTSVWILYFPVLAQRALKSLLLTALLLLPFSLSLFLLLFRFHLSILLFH